MTDALTTWLLVQLDWQEDIARRAKDADRSADRLFEGHCSPSWSLGEVAAKRKILDLLDLTEDRSIPAEAWIIGNRIKEALALPYANRPGYQEAWRP